MQARAAEKAAKGNKGSQLKTNEAALNKVCGVCKQAFLVSTPPRLLSFHYVD